MRFPALPQFKTFGLLKTRLRVATRRYCFNGFQNTESVLTSFSALARVTTTIQYVKTNNQITAPELRVIGEKGENLGIMPREAAFKAAQERGLDLIEIAPLAKPPVARIMDFDKFRYQEAKNLKKKRAHAKNQEIKQVQIGVQSARNDLQIRAKKIEEFFGEGHIVNLIMVMRGRQKGNKNWALEKLREFLGTLAVPYEVLSDPKFTPRGFIMTIKKK